MLATFIIGLAIGALLLSTVSPSHLGQASQAHVATATGGADASAPDPAANAVGYLGPTALEASKFLPTPPEGATQAFEHSVFIATRSSKDTDRWRLAQGDADQSVSATMADFSCAVGVELSPVRAPALGRLLGRFSKDQTAILEPAKSFFHRPRPFVGAKAPLCVPMTDELARSPDYPSGHGSWGWAVALILAEADPDRADRILARGRAYGESRVICGLHSPSAVEAGRTLGSAMVAAANSSASFRSDLQSASAELADLVHTGVPSDASKCAAEQAVIAKAAY